MRTIRKNVFETNSSSTHSITICAKEDYNKWKEGKLYWDRYNESFLTKEEVYELYSKEALENEDIGFEKWMNEDKQFYTYNEFNDYNFIEYETYEENFTTKNGEDIVAFGYYGNDY